ncbi:MAG: hypothetical protein JWO08_2574, partial [Verrucomicrobiaceae bacterium]|nr:hypothetical protein [Verrucomicrobiaceae bacterium]
MQNIEQSSRRQFLGTTIGAAGLVALPTWAKPIGSGDDIRVAVIGFNGRGGGHIGSLLKLKGVRITALCDVDQNVMDKHVASLKNANIEVKQYKDYRELCADKDIDAVTIATPNHSHTLIALTALAAGKHVYVEKPVCHNPTEGRKLVEAGLVANGKGQILQHGMQRRSDLGWAAAMEFVKSGQIGKTTLSRALNYKMRPTIGKVAAPTMPDAAGRIKGEFRDTGGKPQIVDVDYKLWSAPRSPAPMQREQFHYDWHWQWRYGNGDIGNQGPHQLDVARWALGNPTLLPRRVMSLGGRWGYKDDGETANNQLAFYNYEPVPMLMDSRGMPRDSLKWTKGYEPVYKSTGIRVGNVIECEGGYVAESKAYDKDGKVVQKFEILEGPDHMKNFIDSIRAGKRTNENLDVVHGYHAACLAHLA